MFDFFVHNDKALKGCRMGRSDKVSLWYVSSLINTRFRFLFQNKQLLSAFNVTLRQKLPNDSERLSSYNSFTDKKQNGCS